MKSWRNAYRYLPRSQTSLSRCESGGRVREEGKGKGREIPRVLVPNFFRARLLATVIEAPEEEAWFIAELRRPEGPPSGVPYPYRKLRKTHELIDFLVVIMASGIAYARRYCVHTTAVTTTTVESRKMAAILQTIGWQRHTALVYLVLFWYMTLGCNQL